MKHINVWVIVSVLFVGLLLILGSLSQILPIALPLAVVIGLGIPALLLLWEHREKLKEVLRVRPNR